jgi:hypothetical protein
VNGHDYIVATIAGIELAHQIKKQNSTSQLSVLLGYEPPRLQEAVLVA